MFYIYLFFMFFFFFFFFLCLILFFFLWFQHFYIMDYNHHIRIATFQYTGVLPSSCILPNQENNNTYILNEIITPWTFKSLGNFFFIMYAVKTQNCVFMC